MAGGEKTQIDTIAIDTAANPGRAVIWLHGLGADGHDFEPIVPELKLPDALPVRFIFPHAPMRPITINGGAVMRGWYDISNLDDLDNRADSVGVRESGALLSGLIQQQVEAGIPAHRIVLAGFSQGGVIALHVGLRHPERLAGVLALSTYLALANTVEAEASTANRDIPIFMAHGTHDPVIPIQHAEKSRDILLKLDYEIEWETYPMPHAVHPDEIAKIGLWLKSVFD